MPRMTNWLFIALGFSLAALLMAPQQLPVTLYKLNLISLAAWLGYWIDRGLFPYARPDLFEAGQRDGVFSGAMLRRALIVSACIIGVALGA